VGVDKEISVGLVGAGGDGAVAAGDILAMACAGVGLHVIKTEAYGPQIRGGESSCSVRISSEPISAQAGALDAIVVFNWKDFARFRAELVTTNDALVFCEASDAAPDDAPRTLVPVAFNQLARDNGVTGSKNTVAVGLLAAFFALPLDAIRGAIRKRFARKPAAVTDAALKAFDLGVEALPVERQPLPFTVNAPRLLMSGNDAVAFGALHAGCSFFAGYPITPSTEILQTVAEWLPRMGATCIQTEDELAAIGAVAGASFAGAKAMTATSGPGLSLMSEMLGLASIAELPAVIVDVQRGGPSTGIPTKSEQSDLLHALYGSHGDTPRVVLACCDVADAFHTTVDAFNIAEEFQVPVIVLSDQMIGQRRETLDASALVHDVRSRRVAVLAEGEEYKRYADTSDGVSPMTIPGLAGGMYQTNGLEHDEQGRPSSMFVVHEAMNAKRCRKMAAIAERHKLYWRYGDEHPVVGILCWGSSAGPVREAVDALRGSGVRAGAFVPRILNPLPVAELQGFINASERIVVIELSYSAQFHRYLRAEVELPSDRTTVISRSGGKPLSVAEVLAAVGQEVRA
jgi:2-oxoglutarate ferredoxin oxidoreductase subunit alpha